VSDLHVWEPGWVDSVVALLMMAAGASPIVIGNFAEARRSFDRSGLKRYAGQWARQEKVIVGNMSIIFYLYGNEATGNSAKGTRNEISVAHGCDHAYRIYNGQFRADAMMFSVRGGAPHGAIAGGECLRRRRIRRMARRNGAAR
jgi:hypothetical protein